MTSIDDRRAACASAALNEGATRMTPQSHRAGRGGGGEMKIKVGDLVTVDALEWIDPVWEFDNPTVVLRPVYREFETAHLDDAIETVMLDIIADGDGEDESKEYRRWNLRTLKRRFSEAMRGKRFPVANYRAKRQSFVIFRDDDGLMFKEQP